MSVKPKLPRIMTLWMVSALIVCQLSLANGDKESKIIGLVNETADLPCDVDVNSCGSVYFITWTKNVSNEWKRLYLYSDTVVKPLQELANPSRAKFELKNSSGSLTISSLRLEDDGTYKCDVTYVQGKCPSLSYATLFIHAKPSEPVIQKDGRDSPTGSVVGPFNEGASVSLECETKHGKPTPEVTWKKEGEELDSTSHVTVEKNGASIVTSSVSVILDRDDLGKKMECYVDNEATDLPLVTWVELDLHVKPLTLDVLGPEEPVIAGKEVNFTCIVEGAKPAANITWYNRSDVLEAKVEARNQLMPDKTYRTISEVLMTVSRHDHMTLFTCKGTNTVLQSFGEAALLKALEFQVLYPPAVVIQPAEGVVANESDSAIIYCTYEANPFNISEVTWYHEDEELPVPTKKKYEANYNGYPTLTISNIQKEDRGMYSCSLSNAVGSGNSSNDVYVDVLYPLTVEATISPETVEEGQSISLFCIITDGNPKILNRVQWFKDAELMYEITEREISWLYVHRNKSGNYSCKGENSAGWGPRSEEKELVVQYLPGPAVVEEMDPPAIKDEHVTLSCIVEEPGLPPVEFYQWEKDGRLIATTTEPDFVTQQARVDTSGNYSCSAANDVGHGPKGYWFLKVHASPQFIDDLPTIRGAGRDDPSINMTCRVECDPPCGVQWMKNDELIQNTDLYLVRNHRNPPNAVKNLFESITSTLQFQMSAWPDRRLKRDRDRANYTCFSTDNIVGEGVSSTTLFLVEYPPQHLILSDTQVDVVEGYIPKEVECSASSWPPSTFLWRIKDIIVSRDNVLTFNESATRENDGTYVCVAKNRHGEAEIEMELNVLYKPECSISESKDEDGDAVLICMANGNPALINFTWIKDNDTLEEEYQMEFENTQSTLWLANSAERYGTYVCVAINDIGESEPCENVLEGPGVAGGYGDVGDVSVLVIVAIIGSIAIVFVLVIIIMLLIMRKRRQQNAASPAKQVPATGGDNLYQNVSGAPADRKQNGPSVSESEGNVMYENMPFHRQGPYRPDSTDEMVYADLYDDIKSGKVPDPRLKPPLPPKGIGKKPKEPPLPPKTKKGGSDFLGI